MNRLTDRVRAIWPTVRTVLVNVVGAAALAAAAVDAPAAVVAVLVLVGLLSITVIIRRRVVRSPLTILGTYGAARIMLAGSVVVLGGHSVDEMSWAVWLAATVVALTVAVESVMARSWRQSGRLVHALPDGPPTPRRTRIGGRQVVASLVLLALLAITPWLPGWTHVVLLVVAVSLAAVEGVAVITAPALRARRERSLREALEAFAPEVMVYITGPAGTEYQLAAWLPVLDTIDSRIVIVAREHALADQVSRLTSLPVVATPSLADLDALHVPSLRVALYVNNGAKNTHNVRYQDVTHVQLLHGDSDKPASFNPVTAMFDKIFVAGQAGIDRYANHGIHIPAERFAIVGRPQVVGIERPTSRGSVRNALYAPTWTGFQADANYGSLPVGHEIVRALVGRGLTVTFRPHPYSFKEPTSRAQIDAIEQLLTADAAATGRTHVFGVEASSAMTLPDCFNAADLLVTDVSSVPADFLFSEKPFVITKMQPGTVDDFVDEFPLARAAYLAHGDDAGSIDRAVERAAAVDDELAATRRTLRTYYLGDLPYAGYEQTFLAEVRRLVEEGPRSAPERSTDSPQDQVVEDDADLQGSDGATLG
ncbi:CDP-glycerol glycerophosphotransferase family protein [Cellulosimicrobium terreum]|nr:CDP-glycerol glycerophosphotransferase family protein [Cellulosimicrobium terreum]